MKNLKHNENEMTKAECAKYMGICITSLNKMIAEHAISCRIISGITRPKYVFYKDKIDKYMILHDMK